MYHWRTYGGAEVDIIIEYDGRFYPIEVKERFSNFCMFSFTAC